MVVRCGNLPIRDEEFDGVLPVLGGEAGTSERSGPGEGKSSYRSERASVKGYVYADSTREDEAIPWRLHNRGSPRAGKRIC